MLVQDAHFFQHSSFCLCARYQFKENDCCGFVWFPRVWSLSQTRRKDTTLKIKLERKEMFPISALRPLKVEKCCSQWERSIMVICQIFHVLCHLFAVRTNDRGQKKISIWTDFLFYLYGSVVFWKIRLKTNFNPFLALRQRSSHNWNTFDKRILDYSSKKLIWLENKGKTSNF